MKLFLYTAIFSSLMISCTNDCLNIDCIPANTKPFPGFTISSGSKNLLATKEIDFAKIKAFEISENQNREIDVVINSAVNDTIFRVEFEDFYDKIKLVWPGDSSVVDVVYKTTETACCGKTKQVFNMLENGHSLESPNGIIIIKR